mmetsp:Transcript_43381/g.87750  ORF Transcript_43381/g.87750 Transcript_43381/m.87750 type:complete len:218 (+) Transcript_43381:97-750(+)
MELDAAPTSSRAMGGWNIVGVGADPKLEKCGWEIDAADRGGVFMLALLWSFFLRIEENPMSRTEPLPFGFLSKAPSTVPMSSANRGSMSTMQWFRSSEKSISSLTSAQFFILSSAAARANSGLRALRSLCKRRPRRYLKKLECETRIMVEAGANLIEFKSSFRRTSTSSRLSLSNAPVHHSSEASEASSTGRRRRPTISAGGTVSSADSELATAFEL